MDRQAVLKDDRTGLGGPDACNNAERKEARLALLDAGTTQSSLQRFLAQTERSDSELPQRVT